MLTAVLVDDSSDLRLLARLNLEMDGAATIVGEASDGLGGLDLIEALHPDVAVLDIHMPGMSGVEMIRFLRGRGTTTRLIAYSSDDLALRDAVEVGADAAVLKTGELAQLMLAVGTGTGRLNSERRSA